MGKLSPGAGVAWGGEAAQIGRGRQKPGPGLRDRGINDQRGGGCCCWVASVVPGSVRPHRRQPTRLRRPWDSPGKNTGVGCHFLLQCMKVKSESEVAQSCLTLHDHMGCSLPVSSIHGIFQARALEWGAIVFSGPEGLVYTKWLWCFTLGMWASIHSSRSTVCLF